MKKRMQLVLLAGMSMATAMAMLAVPVAQAGTKTSAVAAQKAVSGTVAGPVVSEAWISEAPPVARNNAAFIVLKNGPRADALVGVSTPVAEAAELHQMSMAGGLMRMQRLPLIKLAPNAGLRLAAGSRHIMLIGMKQPLKVGDKVPLTLTFRHAGKVTVEAVVRPVEIESGTSAAGDHEGHGAHAH